MNPWFCSPFGAANGCRLPLVVLTTSLLLVAACFSADEPGVNPAGDDAGHEDVDDNGDAGDASRDDADADPCPVCCPGDVRCSTEQQAVEVCDDSGLGFEVATTCASDEICDDGECIDEPVCEPGEQKCEDSTSIATCRATGTGFTSESCSDGQACHDGQCTTGLATGSFCEDSGECASDQCRCGDDQSCPFVDDGYCTTDCSTKACNPGEICWQAEGIDAAGDNHCLSSCGSTCSLGDCLDVLATDEDGQPEWEEACLPSDLQGVGEECDSDDQCVTGTCFEELDFNFCTLLCEDTGCPDGSACVRLEQGGDHRCLPECQENADCPAGFNIDCNSEFSPDDNFKSVCS